jgi:SpoVK/Ycf46/Vps4 family AAA+-type ATPase
MAKQPVSGDAPVAALAIDKDADSMEFCVRLDQHIRAGYQCLSITSPEEARLEQEIKSVAKAISMHFVTWDCANGFSAPESVRGKTSYRSPHEALRAIGEVDGPFKGNTVFVFRDLDDFYRDPTVIRLIRTLTEGNKLVNGTHKHPLIITSPKQSIHDKIKSCLAVVDFDLPGSEKLHHVLNFVQKSISSADDDKVADCTAELGDQIVACLRGLTSSEAENALARCVVKHGGFTEEILGTIKDEKASIIKKSEVLTYIPETSQVDRSAIGGFEQFLDFVDRRKLSYAPEARTVGLDFPKGVVLLGPPGTGKSLVGKAACKLLGLPGYIMDIGAVFGSLVGESEQRMREALKQVEAQQGCVLLLDEADKAFGGAADSQGDSGVTRRVFGQLLTWLAEKQDSTFVIMTMNRTRGIPPEFLRPGRFDAIFYTDLPQEREREDILKIHFRNRGVNPEELELGKPEWNEIIKKTKDFTGAELEEAVRESRYISYEARRSGAPSFAELTQAVSGIIPLSTLDAEGISSIREFCKGRAKPVSMESKRRRAMSTEPEQRSISVN